jgi:hypothetical protein
MLKINRQNNDPETLITLCAITKNRLLKEQILTTTQELYDTPATRTTKLPPDNQPRPTTPIRLAPPTILAKTFQEH